MATDTKNCVMETMDVMTKGFQNSLESGRKAQQAWFDALNGFKVEQPAFGRFFSNPDQFAGEFMPVWRNNAKSMFDCLDTNMKATFAFMRTACDAVVDAGEKDFAQASKRVCDDAFETTNANFETFHKATRNAFDQWTSFCKCQEGGSGPTTKSGSRTSK